MASQAPPPADSRDGRATAYWRRNLLYLVILLSIWFAISFGAGIFLADALNAIRIPGTGFELGFWFAQQGSIYGFLALILAYVLLMNRLDRRMGVDEEPVGRRRAAPDPRRVVGERV